MLLNCFETFCYSFDIMRCMFFQRKARNTKKSIITRKTDDTKLLLGMNLTKDLIKSRFWTITPRIKSFSKWCYFFSGLIMRLKLLVTRTHRVVTKLILILIFLLAILFLTFLLEQRHEYMVSKLIYSM